MSEHDNHPVADDKQYSFTNVAMPGDQGQAFEPDEHNFNVTP